MKPQTQTYFFGRVNTISNVTDKRQLFFQAFTANKFHMKGDYKYGFFTVREIDSDFAYGLLVKYKPMLEGEVVDENVHQLVEGGLPDGVVAKSDFFIHIPSSVIAYRPITNKISSSQFRETFAHLIEVGHENFFVSVKVESIDEELRIEEALKKFDQILVLSFDIHPTNPSNRDTYKSLDEKLKLLNADKMKQTLESKSGGLNKSAILDDDSYRALIMAIDGYGKGVIHGTIEGNHKVISTEDSPVRKDVIVSNNPKDILDQLLPEFEKIWKRITERK